MNSSYLEFVLDFVSCPRGMCGTGTTRVCLTAFLSRTWYNHKTFLCNTYRRLMPDYYRMILRSTQASSHDWTAVHLLSRCHFFFSFLLDELCTFLNLKLCFVFVCMFVCLFFARRAMDNFKLTIATCIFFYVPREKQMNRAKLSRTWFPCLASPWVYNSVAFRPSPTIEEQTAVGLAKLCRLHSMLPFVPSVRRCKRHGRVTLYSVLFSAGGAATVTGASYIARLVVWSVPFSACTRSTKTHFKRAFEPATLTAQ